VAEAADGAESIDAAAGVDSQCAGSPITRARKNLAALEALAAAEERGSATAEEIAAMEAYSGWGGAQKAFSENAEGEWGEIRDRLKNCSATTSSHPSAIPSSPRSTRRHP
jgi:hypothetical protein